MSANWNARRSLRWTLTGLLAATVLMTGALGAASAGQFSAPANSEPGAIVRVGDSRDNTYEYRNRKNARTYQRNVEEGYRLRERQRRYYRHRPHYYYEPAPYGYYAPPPAYYYPQPEPSFSFGLTLPIR